MSLTPEISIVIVNYRTYSYTAKCLGSILANPPLTPFEIIIVDNASGDGSVESIAANYPQVRLLTSEKNSGIAGGNNLGILASKGKYVLLLNNDTLVLPGTIDRCAAFLDEHPEAGGVGGNLINPDGSFQSGAFNYPSIYDEFLHLSKLGNRFPRFAQSRSFDTIREVDWLSTAFMLFQRAALEQVGFLDELFFIYSDETDLEYRLSKAGWKIYYHPEINTIHFGGKSLSPWKSRTLVFRGRLLFFRKHKSWYEELLVRFMYLISCLPKLLFWSVNIIISKRRVLAKNELLSHYGILLLSFRKNFSRIE